MKIVIQRVSEASVVIDNQIYGSINYGFLVFLGIQDADTEDDAIWLTKKLIALRVFGDKDGKMNLAIKNVSGSILVISQFTLYSSTKKGNRPSFIKAAKPQKAIPLYDFFINELRKSGVRVKTGIFGADMKVSLVNDGPVTIIIDSKLKE